MVIQVLVAFTFGRQIGVENGYERNLWVPDLVANIRVDQGWGSAQLMGFLGWREAGILGSGGWYTNSDSDVAFGVGGGVSVNVPFGTGTSLGIQAAYAHGGPDYVAADVGNGFVPVWDGYYDAGDNSLDLTDAFSVAGALSTSFTPAIAYTLAGGYAFFDQNDSSAFGDVSTITVDSYLTYEIVQNFVLGAGIQYKYVDTDNAGEGSALAGFLRAQRTF